MVYGGHSDGIGIEISTFLFFQNDKKSRSVYKTDLDSLGLSWNSRVR